MRLLLAGLFLRSSYHTACRRPAAAAVIVIGVVTSFNAAAFTPKAIDKITKPIVFVVTITAAAAAASGWPPTAATGSTGWPLLSSLSGWPTLPPPSILLLLLRSVLSRVLYLAVQLTARSRWTLSRTSRRTASTSDGVLGRVARHVLNAFLHAGLVDWFHDVLPQQVRDLV